jgi:hypothetical protein
MIMIYPAFQSVSSPVTVTPSLRSSSEVAVEEMDDHSADVSFFGCNTGPTS